MSFLLDTNIVSELRKGRRANAKVRAWIGPIQDEDLYTSVLVVGEVRQGIEGVRRHDPATAVNLDRWLDQLLESYAMRVLPIDLAVAELWGHLNVPDPLPAIDGMLAATALVNNLTLVTRNVRDVARTGVRVVNPFT